MTCSSRSQKPWNVKFLWRGQQDERDAGVPYCRGLFCALTVAAARQDLKCFSSSFCPLLDVYPGWLRIISVDLSTTHFQFMHVPPPRTFPEVYVMATHTFVVTELPPSCSQRQSSNGHEVRNKHPQVDSCTRVSWHSITLERAWRLTVKSPGRHNFQNEGQEPSSTQTVTIQSSVEIL